jgi:hypothetical protein
VGSGWYGADLHAQQIPISIQLIMYQELSENEKAYRRGLDQGVALFAYAIGVDNDSLQATSFKQRVKQFRSGELESADSLWNMSAVELLELQLLVKNLLTTKS